MVNFEAIKSEKGLRTLIKRNLNKEIHPATKPSIDFIYKILEDAYSSGLNYDVTDMRNAVLAFAASSTHQADYCIKLVNKMQFKSTDPSEAACNDDAKLVFYDIEVFPNLFLVNWKVEGEGKPVVRMINPSPSEIEELVKFRLVGFNNRRYDDHILYARLMGYSNEQLYKLSQKIVTSKKGANRDCFFSEAYNLSYTDVYDFAAKKQSLKKWEIELGIHHQELGLPWDKPVPEEMWTKVAEYCDNDVIATEAVFHHLKGDWTARQILANLAGMPVNSSTNSLTTRIIFGKERKPKLVYTDLATGEPSDPQYKRDDIITAFPGYEFKDGKNLYRGEDIGKGGYIRSNPGVYTNVALLDVASLHPTSIIAMNCFGEYTQHFKDIKDARIAIKHGDFDKARKMLNGRLAPYLTDESTAKDLAQALKIAINSVYGLTAANFENPFRDIRNKNNIVALRGALFMKTLRDEIESRGFDIVAVKTDSVKIANATKEIIDFCMDFARKYGYEFEHEATYDRICQINDADYIARYKNNDWCEKTYGYIPGDNTKHPETWTATGAQFQVPYVFKKLFSKEPIEFDDMCETKSVSTSLYLDMNENLTVQTEAEKELAERLKLGEDPEVKSDYIAFVDPAFMNVTTKELSKIVAKGHNYIFIGRVGQFCPIKPGCGGGLLMREKDGKYYAATGSKGYRWLESEMVRELNKINDIDRSYYDKLCDDAVANIAQYCDFEWFVAEDN